ncbi:exonuclease [Actinoallomurus sp. NPDC052274]|uniref:exonuclease n=1 Tax=Actinoallomurus sp. NPDC052274 TaxID=3155420 RepID=UPI003412B21E
MSRNETPRSAGGTAPDVYISADVEADGPIPGPYSMISFGLAVAGTYDGRTFERRDPEAATFYAELRPISDEYDAAALAVSGLDRERLLREGRDPAAAMSAAARWVEAVGRAEGGKPVFAAYPLGFDWMFLYWYFVRFAETGSPFGHSRFLDLKTLYAARSGETVTRSVKGRMPRHLLSRRRHTHHALDDAVEQAELLQNLMAWDGAPAR